MFRVRLRCRSAQAHCVDGAAGVSLQTALEEKEEASVALAEQIRARLERLEDLDRSRLYDVAAPALPG